ncbi:hypothetical protein [Methyloligella solikamskensis]|uniref:Uncharacterized protein n=1 Tax=Methyloligella solikamskensis TaxID=1177756 RepID=A0ABW3J792_9HYPH
MNLSATDRAFLRGQFGETYPGLTPHQLDDLAEALFAEHYENNPAYTWDANESSDR